MLPQHYIPLEALPLSTNGKVDRNALPAPDTQPIDQADQIAPTTATQIEIATIWSEVLKVPRIGIEADFFELGGDSLLATQALSRLRTTFQLELSLRDFLTKPTVADLAQQIDLLSKVQELRPTAPLLAGEEDETW
jgi:acyl carrier protein